MFVKDPAIAFRFSMSRCLIGLDLSNLTCDDGVILPRVPATLPVDPNEHERLNFICVVLSPISGLPPLRFLLKPTSEIDARS